MARSIRPCATAHRLSSAVAMSRFYDLFVLLDPEAPEERRAAIVEQVKSQIDSGGATLKGDADWGMRRLSYEIDHRRGAQHPPVQLQGPPEGPPPALPAAPAPVTGGGHRLTAHPAPPGPP